MNKYQLSNGIQVITEKIPSTRSVSFGIWVKAGSRNETALLNGITHLIEHMLFKGTSNYSARDIADIFDGLGGNINAFTSKENTCYYFIVLDEHLPQALAVLADMFFYSLFAPDELEKEKKVVYEEISMYEDTPDDQVHDLIANASYAHHSLGRPILGDHERLASFQSQHLRDYMADHYSIGNIVISIAGNIDDDLPELLERHFTFYENVGKKAHVEKADFTSGLVYRHKQTEQNHICLALPGLALSDKRMYAMSVLNNIVGGGMSSRLFQEVREQRGMAYSVYSYHVSYADSGLFVIYAGTAPEQTKQLLDVTLEVIADLQSNGISDAELRRTKEQLKGNFILSSESSSSRMMRIGRDMLMMQKFVTADEILENINNVTTEDVRALMRSMLDQPFAVAMVGDHDDHIQSFRRDQLVLSR